MMKKKMNIHEIAGANIMEHYYNIEVVVTCGIVLLYHIFVIV